MATSVVTEGETVVVPVVGHLIIGNRKEVQRQVTEALERGARHVVVDLAASGYVDSAGLGTLVVLAKRVRAAGGEFRLANVNEEIGALLRLTRLDTVLGGRGSGPAAS